MCKEIHIDLKNKKVFLPFEEAKIFVRKLNLKNIKEWKCYHRSQKGNSNIPVAPYAMYKKWGWVSWMDWLGTDNIQGCKRKYKVNDDYFKKWSHNMGYILGLWFADGCLYRGNYFSITLKEKYLIKKILKEMGSNNPIRKKGNCFYFEINSKKIYNDIIKLGGKEIKSLDVKFPMVPKKYLSDFVRGLWDGDGCIYLNKKIYCSSYVCGSKAFIYELHHSLKKNISQLTGSIQRSKAYYLSFSKNDTVKLRDFIYKNDSEFKLKRKSLLFKKARKTVVRKYLTYDQANIYVKKLKFKNVKEWKEYSKTTRISEIPSHPDYFYKNKGWIDWKKWLGNSWSDPYHQQKGHRAFR